MAADARYTALGLAGRYEDAAKVSKQLESLRPIYLKYMRDKWVNENLIPIVYVKAWSELMGMAAGPVRPGLPQLTAAEKQTLRAEVEGAGLPTAYRRRRRRKSHERSRLNVRAEDLRLEA